MWPYEVLVAVVHKAGNADQGSTGEQAGSLVVVVVGRPWLELRVDFCGERQIAQ